MNSDVLPAQANAKDTVPLSYKLVSESTIVQFENGLVNLAWLGSLRYGGEVLSAEMLADKFVQQENLQRFYAQLSGRFWLFVQDKNSNIIHLVNDPVGMQICYFSVQQGCLFVSDSLDKLRSIKQLSCTISEQAIFNYFYFHCIPAPATIYEECEKLQAGVQVIFAADGSKHYDNLYRPNFASACQNQSELQEQCLATIDEAVKENVSYNCGAFLSGGLDSSTVAGMLARHQEKARTFSIGFDAKDFDETPYAKLTARHFSTDHQVHYLQPEQAAKEFVKVAQYFDEPFGNSSAMAAYFCAKFAKEQGVTKLLAGDGGDELFAGNSRYAKQKIFEHFHGAPEFLQALPRALFTNTLAERLPLLRKVASYIKQADVPLPDRLETYNFVHQLGADAMFNPEFLAKVDTEQPVQQQRSRYNDCPSTDPVDRMLYLDWKFTLADNDLVKVNKMCELAGVEVVYPLLERKVMNFSCRVPASVKLPGSKLRDFYKKACSGFLADETLSKSKHGFGLPFGEWMKENAALKELSMDCLQAFKKRNIVSDSLIGKVLKAHESVHAGYYGELIWLMVVLELWLQGKDCQ